MLEEAVLWHARLREPNAPASQHAAFLTWLNRDPQHRAAYEEIHRIWNSTAPAALAVARETKADTVSIRPAYMVRRFLLPAALAATVLLAIVVSGWLYNGGYDDLRSDYVAAKGEQRSITLEDGSKLTLNTDTAIAVDLQPQRRLIKLFRGEAFFTVAPDPGRPFVIQTPSGEIRVVGTAFNLRLLDHGAVVSVVQGRVEAAASSGSYVRLVAGQQATVSEIGVTPPRSFDSASTTAWQRGQIVFYRSSLGEVVEELNRYHGGRILVLGDELRDLRVSGVFDLHHPTTALEVIARTLPVRVMHLTGGLTILR